MPDNWGYVAAAYALTAVMLAGYWRHLVRRATELTAPRATRRTRQSARISPAPGSPPAGP
jgi:heme exporter protein D